MNIELRKNPTYIPDDGRVEIKCKVDGKDRRIFMEIDEFMNFLKDEMKALEHYLTRE